VKSLAHPTHPVAQLGGQCGGQLQLRGGVRNVFGKNPPVTDNNSAPASSINGNTFPGTYDSLGRVIFIGATAKL